MIISNAIAHNSTAYSFNTLINKVFNWLGIGTLTSTTICYWFVSSAAILSTLETTSGMTAWRYLAMSVPIAFVLHLYFESFELNHFSCITLLIFFCHWLE